MLIYILSKKVVYKLEQMHVSHNNPERFDLYTEKGEKEM